jgi:hypothetical protein
MTMFGATVNGGISARNGGQLTAVGPSVTISGNLEVRGGGTVIITGGVTIGGGLQVEQLASSTTMNLICRLQRTGNLQWLDNAAPVTIGGTGCLGNTISEDLQVQDNTMPSGYTRVGRRH